MLIVGLGNPTEQYANTHHNVGFMALDKIQERYNLKFKKSIKYNALISTFTINNQEIVLMKPLTYMNLSGQSVSKYVKSKHVDLKDILVIYDDMDLPLGKLRIRKNGSSGGHNGIKSIIAELGGTQEFSRVRIGIDKPIDASGNQIIDYVLKKFTKTELDILNPLLDVIPDLVNDLSLSGIDYIMNHYNNLNNNK